MTETFAQASALARKLELPWHAVIDGSRVGSLSGRTFDNIGPRDGKPINTVAECDAEDIDRAVRAARIAYEDGRWRNQGPRAMKRVLGVLADLMQRHAQELALLETLDTGKPLHDSLSVDIPLAINTTRWYAEAVDKIYGEVGVTTANKVSMAVHEPLGVIGAIVPWNFPLHMAMWKVAPALAMGNSVVLKPAEQSPMTALRLGELALEAGVPPGVLNIVPGFGASAGQALALHMDVDMIAFTGSGPVGRKLMTYSAQSNLKRVSLELGGKSPQIVFANCPDFDTAAQAAAWGVFYNQGQVCTASSRLLIERRIADEFLQRVVKIAREIRPGDPLDPATRFGAMVSAEQMQTTLRFVEAAQSEGARLQLGGRRVLADTGGFYVEPAIFDQVNNDMRLAREEVFGPVLAALTFEDAEDAIRIANDTPYGLGAGLWTSDLTTTP